MSIDDIDVLDSGGELLTGPVYKVKTEREMKSIVEKSSNGQRLAAGSIWVISALLTFGFGYIWLHPLFSPLFFGIFPPGGAFPTAARTIGGILGGLFVALTFDLGALNALRVYIYTAETEDQQDITYQVLWVDFIGSVVASVAQIFFSLSGSLLTLSVQHTSHLGYGILLVTVGVFTFNLVQSIKYFLASPEVLRAKFKAEQNAKALKRKQTRAASKAKIINKILDDESDEEVRVLGEANKIYMKKAQEAANEIANKKAAAFHRRLMKREGLEELGENLPPNDKSLPPVTPTYNTVAANYGASLPFATRATGSFSPLVAQLGVSDSTPRFTMTPTTRTNGNPTPPARDGLPRAEPKRDIAKTHELEVSQVDQLKLFLKGLGVSSTYIGYVTKQRVDRIVTEAKSMVSSGTSKTEAVYNAVAGAGIPASAMNKLTAESNTELSTILLGGTPEDFTPPPPMI